MINIFSLTTRSLNIYEHNILILARSRSMVSLKRHKNQLLQLCTAHTVFSILVTVQLYTVTPEVCRWLTNETQRKGDIRLTDQ